MPHGCVPGQMMAAPAAELIFNPGLAIAQTVPGVWGSRDFKLSTAGMPQRAGVSEHLD